jgi:hypothetical protein
MTVCTTDFCIYTSERDYPQKFASLILSYYQQNLSMEQESGFSYFNEAEPFEWSLIGFLEWKSKTSHILDKNREHSAFKSFLQNIANDKNNTKSQRAQELLDNWKACNFYVLVLLAGQGLLSW